MKVKIKLLDEDAKIPTQATDGSAGLDVYASQYPQYYPGKGIVEIKTGIALQPPEGYYFYLHPRSSCGKYLIWLANGTGVIDQDYTGEIKLHYYTADYDFKKIAKGDRVGQLILHKRIDFDFFEVNELNETKRGSGGFGHTGTN